LHIYIYESSSHGGCYKYAIELYHAYRQHPAVEGVTLLLPANATFEGQGIQKILIPDNQTGNKFHFLYRHFANPLRLLKYVKKAEKSNNLKPETLNCKTSSFILLNDFEQMSAPLWSPFFRLLLRNIKIGVFLHDADRDAYPPSPTISAWCMQQMMKCMDVALYHGVLPNRQYYHLNGKTHYLQVEHGLYHLPPPDEEMKQKVVLFTRPFRLSLAIIGHIREEKNYRLVMQALVNHPDLCLVIAGSAANSKVDVTGLQQLAIDLGIAERVLWINHYLSEPEMTAVISAIDWIVLYYAPSFHAQSGILNQTAPLRKPVLVSDLPNALTETVTRYQLGIKCKADDITALSDTLFKLHQMAPSTNWEFFFEAVDWRKQTEYVIAQIQTSK